MEVIIARMAQAGSGSLEELFPQDFMLANPWLSWNTIAALDSQLYVRHIRQFRSSQVQAMVNEFEGKGGAGAGLDTSMLLATPVARFDGSYIPNLYRRDDQSLFRRIPPGFGNKETSVFNVASAHNYSYYLLCRAIVEHSLPSSSSNKNHRKQQVKAVFRDPAFPSNISSPTLRQDIIDSMDVDRHYSPHLDLVRSSVGLAFEFKLQRILLGLGINDGFETERQLQERGVSKTPDVLLLVPLGVWDDKTRTHRVVHWIDSKAMFGDAPSRNENIDQMLEYVNRFGSGMVIYWFGVHPDLVSSCFRDVIITSEFPFTENLVVLGR
jgi:hypothetical protein